MLRLASTVGVDRSLETALQPVRDVEIGLAVANEIEDGHICKTRITDGENG